MLMRPTGVLCICLLWAKAAAADEETDAPIKCGRNEVYSCAPCFEPSCYAFLYDGEDCPQICEMDCNCKLGYVRRKRKCVKKIECCSRRNKSPNCDTVKEENIKEMRLKMNKARK